jgi:hypothetical protein
MCEIDKVSPFPGSRHFGLRFNVGGQIQSEFWNGRHNKTRVRNYYDYTRADWSKEESPFQTHNSCRFFF